MEKGTLWRGEAATISALNSLQLTLIVNRNSPDE